MLSLSFVWGRGLSKDAGHEASTNGFRPLDRSAYTIRRRASFPSTLQSINDAVTLILEVARRCGCASEHEADLEIALREALANAVIHGNGEDENRQWVHTRIEDAAENLSCV